MTRIPSLFTSITCTLSTRQLSVRLFWVPGNQRHYPQERRAQGWRVAKPRALHYATRAVKGQGNDRH